VLRGRLQSLCGVSLVLMSFIERIDVLRDAPVMMASLPSKTLGGEDMVFWCGID
jgi:hypothetical protein